MQCGRETRHKCYVKVRADFMLDGRVVPLKFRPDEGDAVLIDRVLDERPACSIKAGGQGVRYTCRVAGQVLYLFHDRNLWFIET